MTLGVWLIFHLASLSACSTFSVMSYGAADWFTHAKWCVYTLIDGLSCIQWGEEGFLTSRYDIGKRWAASISAAANCRSSIWWECVIGATYSSIRCGFVLIYDDYIYATEYERNLARSRLWLLRKLVAMRRHSYSAASRRHTSCSS